MRIFDWSQVFEERRTIDDIPARVRKMEIGYWIWLLVGIGISLWGLAVMSFAPPGEIKAMLFGLFLALDGIIAVATLKIVTHVRLTRYWIVWDYRNRLDAEMKKSQVDDL